MLRGINVGHKQIKMGDLQELFLALGHSEVTTYIQSGNVIFDSPVDRPSDVADGIERRITQDLGLPVKVLLRSGDQLAKILEENPFLRGGADPTKLHVTFLAAAPDPAVRHSLEVKNAEPDEFRLLNQEVYLHCPQGYGRTKLNNTFWERRLGVVATTRNWNTVSKLLQLANG
jgi:uncharacterized protein (DUF1697 family)